MNKQMFIKAALAVVLLMPAFQANAEWSWKGDLRYRFESIDNETKVERNRQRIRARLAIKGEVNEDMDVHLRMASGSDDPVSTNATLDTAGTTKGFHLDRAYLDYHPASAEGLAIWAGKMKNPLVLAGKSELIWDGDLSPEGIALKYKSETGEGTELFFNAVYYILDERSASKDDAFMMGVQGGLVVELDTVTLTVGAGYYDFEEIELQSPIYDDDSFGNTVTGITLLDEVGVLAHDYNISEIFAEAKTKINDVPFSIFANYAVNGEADDNDTGYQFGAKVGKAKDPGTWDAKIIFKDVEKDAVYGTWTDSDFGGGGTNADGIETGFGVALLDNVKFGFTAFLNEVDPDGNATDYKRYQGDIKVKY